MSFQSHMLLFFSYILKIKAHSWCWVNKDRKGCTAEQTVYTNIIYIIAALTYKAKGCCWSTEALHCIVHQTLTRTVSRICSELVWHQDTELWSHGGSQELDTISTVCYTVEEQIDKIVHCRQTVLHTVMAKNIGTLGKYDQRRLWKWICIVNPFDRLLKTFTKI